jgi:hypothetical protein
LLPELHEVVKLGPLLLELQRAPVHKPVFVVAV